MGGSSPLARGLQERGLLGVHVGGIIPARAGFTGTWPPRGSRWGDHPRSRGVYYPWDDESLQVVGSSPLARGLRGAERPRGSAARIIPARAGFTGTLNQHSPGRGGSSPLARGLRRDRSGDVRRLRIIPARAGFTAPPPTHPGGSRDHPRSRGVYSLCIYVYAAGDGSSPLARGLRHGEGRDHRRGRIIPARAGFTVGVVGHGPVRQDHPRSRGVYRSTRSPAPDLPGSSPLARGLQPGRKSRNPPGGIIPARAGFTGARGLYAVQARDHPRSRGVYGPSPPPREPDSGSSPLARGLHTSQSVESASDGIIPARAGFTRTTRSTGGPRPDHPRSRGVYHAILLSSLSSGGSSPLARGLPNHRS